MDGLAAYAANRTGSTGGLWGAGGPVPVAEARRAIAQNGGAVLTTVVTVPNDIAQAPASIAWTPGRRWCGPSGRGSSPR